ncbi:preprotein translocase subunit YajC [Phycisphaeraceae bacterium D3-23]
MNVDLFTLTLAQVGDELDGAPAGNSSATDGAPVEGQPAGDGETPPPKKQGLFGGSMFWVIMLGMIVLWIFLLGGGSRKQKKRQAEMLAGMTKGAKVVTIGGIKGSVVEVRDDEVLVKVDESANTRLRFSRDAIRSVTDGSSTS